ncbi:MAG TPA: YihY/virulence factor BrkB family protein [Thermodesulfovibrionales bacterium]|nr:YihY/virulence factor BrkB family protein [Thermodesulfovibrionales bacterium]
MILIRIIQLIFRSFVDFFRDGGPMLAGSISFFTMMAIVPFCLLLVTIFGYFLGENREFYHFFLSKLVSFFPKITSQITTELGNIITHKGLGRLSLLLYGFLSYELFSSLEKAIHVTFKTKEGRSFFVSFILSLVVITLIIAFLLISFSATSLMSMLKTLKEFFPRLQISEVTGFFIRFVIPLLLVQLNAMTLYLFLPKKRVKLFHAVSGAFFTAIFLEAAKHLFTLYVMNVVRLGTIYGPLSAFVIFLLWVFYSSCIFLVGAELVHNLGTSKKGR